VESRVDLNRSSTVRSDSAPVTRDERRNLLAGLAFGEATTAGLSIANLEPGTFFFDSGLRPGDVIVHYDGQPIRSEADLKRWVVYRPGERVPMVLLRNGRQETVYITYPPLAADRITRYEVRRPIEAVVIGGRGFLGVRFEPQVDDAALVRDVVAGSAAEQIGIREGDIIIGLNGQPVATYREAVRLIRSMRAGDPVEIEFTRRINDRAQGVLGAEPPAKPRAETIRPAVDLQEYRSNPSLAI
jgi:S1-C subfamily serine protease